MRGPGPRRGDGSRTFARERGADGGVAAHARRRRRAAGRFVAGGVLLLAALLSVPLFHDVELRCQRFSLGASSGRLPADLRPYTPRGIHLQRVSTAGVPTYFFSARIGNWHYVAVVSEE